MMEDGNWRIYQGVERLASFWRSEHCSLDWMFHFSLVSQTKIFIHLDSFPPAPRGAHTIPAKHVEITGVSCTVECHM